MTLPRLVGHPSHHRVRQSLNKYAYSLAYIILYILYCIYIHAIHEYTCTCIVCVKCCGELVDHGMIHVLMLFIQGVSGLLLMYQSNTSPLLPLLRLVMEV